MRLVVLASALTMSICELIACSKPPKEFPISYQEARTLSDSFMEDLVVDRTASAIEKMEPEFIQSVGSLQAEIHLHGLFAYCGHPLDSEFKSHAKGTKTYRDGRRKPVWIFYYAARTDRFAKGVCFFTVTVVRGEKGPEVTQFGPLKLQSGHLPE